MTFSGSAANLLFTICLVVIFNKVHVRSHPLCFQNFCYFVGQNNFSWHRAKTYCENIGGSLASIHSIEENEFLKRLLRLSNSWHRNMWIGLNSLNSDGTFQWSDWTDINFTFAANGSIDSLDEEICFSIKGINGRWNSDPCSLRYGYICKQANGTSVSTVIPTTQDPRIGNCKEGWIPYFDRCYYIGGRKEEERLNWTEAESFCNMNGGYLTSIRNSKEDKFLGYLLQIIGEDAWIGFRFNSKDRITYWTDNSEVKYLGLHKLDIRGSCFKMMYNNVNSDLWKSDECDRKLGFICQTSKDPKLPPLPTDPDINCVHPEGWMKLNNMCFKLFEGSPLTWNEAELTCENEGGHLASVSDPSVNALAAHLAEEINQPFFIGLKYDKESRSFKWLNNFPVALTKWSKHEPTFISENTCFSSTLEGRWKKAPCDEKMAYLCQIATDKPKKLNKYVGNCSSSSNLWIQGNNSYCYILSQYEKLKWFHAYIDCKNYGSRLIALHSLEESEEVIKLIKPGIRSVFLGIVRYALDGYMWDDDSPVNFVNWDEDEPSTLDLGEEECVEMMTDSMKWRITNCENQRSYVCMGVKSTLAVGDLDDLPDSEYSVESQTLSTSVICLIAFSALVSATLIVATAWYRKEIYSMLRFKRRNRSTSVAFENALYDETNTSTVMNNESKS